tara:strand:- start:281 stop:427 length:147 start_codon:yes stop_codon:yes gene_type:complete
MKRLFLTLKRGVKGIIDKKNREEINKIRTALEQLERAGQPDVIDIQPS